MNFINEYSHGIQVALSLARGRSQENQSRLSLSEKT
jgi:hypothetical protein